MVQEGVKAALGVRSGTVILFGVVYVLVVWEVSMAGWFEDGCSVGKSVEWVVTT